MSGVTEFFCIVFLAIASTYVGLLTRELWEVIRERRELLRQEGESVHAFLNHSPDSEI